MTFIVSILRLANRERFSLLIQKVSESKVLVLRLFVKEGKLIVYACLNHINKTLKLFYVTYFEKDKGDIK